MSYDAYGDLEVLHLSDLPDPKLAPSAVLVEVRSASVNPVDWKLMGGGLDGLMDVVFPVVPGWDAAGVVVATGPDVPELAVGDEVLTYARKDLVQGGTYAEKLAVPAVSVARKPAAMSWDEAGGLPLAGLTALRMVELLEVGSDDVVLVHGASGGVGHLAVQIAAALGARVVGTASERNHDFLRDLGAEPVVYGEGLEDRVRALAPEGATVVLDTVGGVLEQTLAVLAEDGRHASITDPTVEEHGGRWVWVRPDAAALGRLTAVVERGQLRVEVQQSFPLEQTADAVRLSQGGHVRGKVALRVTEG
ncbi:NADP-dependent oxidoreductase [uncultured Pseudokineococcus sp.]|uniref:NADP-dependent oxidoreductase n=1 Tax=uncultured Pseudokineococcus sp. TaxID=1642928 RepID=UPI002623217D|nr:NADP-dependent oxidoreductase [uncultured Pseudokineococcus sp.]